MRSLSLSTSSSRGRTYTRRGRVSDCQSASPSAISWATNCKFTVSQVAVRLSASYLRKAAAFRLPRNEVLPETTVVPEAHSPRISRLHNTERPVVGHSTTNAKLIKSIDLLTWLKPSPSFFTSWYFHCTFRGTTRHSEDHLCTDRRLPRSGG